MKGRKSLISLQLLIEKRLSVICNLLQVRHTMYIDRYYHTIPLQDLGPLQFEITRFPVNYQLFERVDIPDNVQIDLPCVFGLRVGEYYYLLHKVETENYTSNCPENFRPLIEYLNKRLYKYEMMFRWPTKEALVNLINEDTYITHDFTIPHHVTMDLEEEEDQDPFQPNVNEDMLNSSDH